MSGVYILRACAIFSSSLLIAAAGSLSCNETSMGVLMILINHAQKSARTILRMVFKTPVKPEWRERCAAGTMAL